MYHGKTIEEYSFRYTNEDDWQSWEVYEEKTVRKKIKDDFEADLLEIMGEDLSDLEDLQIEENDIELINNFLTNSSNRHNVDLIKENKLEKKSTSE